MLLVNNLGSTTQMEMNIVARDALQCLGLASFPPPSPLFFPLLVDTWPMPTTSLSTPVRACIRACALSTTWPPPPPEEEHNVRVQRVLVGTFMTSLEMAGVSLSVLLLRDRQEELLELLDEETDAPGWPRVSRQAPNQSNWEPPHEELGTEELELSHSMDTSEDAPLLKSIFKGALVQLVDHEDLLTELDSVCGSLPVM